MTELPRRILVPVDFSQASLEATRRALHLAEVMHARVTLLHVIDNRYIGGLFAGLAANPVDHWLEVGREAEREMRSFVAALPAGSPEPETTICEGLPFEETVRLAERLPAQLIVVGSRGRTGIERFLMGSQAELILRHARTPVMVVRSPEQPAAH